MLVACLAAQSTREIRALVKDGSPAIPELAEYLKNPDLKIRTEVVKGLVDIGGPKTIDPLIEATHDNDGQLQVRAVDGLVNIYVPGYVAQGLTANVKRVGSNIKQRFVDNNDQVVDPYIIVRPEVVQAIGALIGGGNGMESRANAARAVGILRGRAALSELYQGLRSKDSDVLYESIVAIGKIREAEGGPHIQFLLRDLSERVQLAAIETTGVLQNRAAAADLRSVLDTTSKPKIRRAALGAIAMFPDPANRTLYVQLVADKDEGMRTAAAEGLGRLKAAEDLPTLQKAYDTETKRAPQLALAFGMVLDGRTETTENSPLSVLAGNLGSTAYRGVVRGYLTELAQDPGVRLQLYGLLDRGDKEVKLGIAPIAGSSGDPQAAAHLEKLSRDADPQIAQEGLRALKNLRASK